LWKNGKKYTIFQEEMAMSTWLEKEDVNFDGEEFDPVLNDLKTKEETKRKASARDWNISHQYADVFYAGTNTRPERIELERNLKRMINEGRFSYKFMEGYLISLGYQRDEIVRAFKHLTGIHPYDLLNPGKFLSTPPTIPGISMGWGVAKDKTYDFYFINPYNWGFALFGQKGDTQRDVVEMYITSDKAIAGLKDHVKEAMLFDEPLTKDVMKDFKDEGPELSTLDSNPSILLQASARKPVEEVATAGEARQIAVDWQSAQSAESMSWREVAEWDSYFKQLADKFPELADEFAENGIVGREGSAKQLSERASSLYRQLSMRGTSTNDVRIMIEGALEFGHITASEADWIRTALVPGEPDTTLKPATDSQDKATETGMSEKLMEVEDGIKSKPFDDEKNQVTPSEYFDAQQEEVDVDKAATENVAKVLEYIKQKNSVLRNFIMRVSSFKYHGRELSEKLENDIQVPGQDVDQFFSANAILSVLVDVIDNSLPEEINTKPALLVFVIAEGQVVFDDTSKFSDNKIYAVSEEGFAKAFFRERQQAHSEAAGEL
jgi:hypothetical protein